MFLAKEFTCCPLRDKLQMEAGVKDRTYIAIDLKSFYASVECSSRGLDPLDTNLVVADESRSEKTICLAVSPSLKAYGIGGRCRLFEVYQKLREVNGRRRQAAPYHRLAGKSSSDSALRSDPRLAVDFIIAKPRMALYMEISARIYDIYLRYIAPDDIHVYSIDEVFIDATDYLQLYSLSPRDLAMKMILSVLSETGITATAGIGPNLYLAKIAMDIMAKHMKADENGVRIAELDEAGYRKALWSHRPITDFWRVGQGYARKLEEKRLYTMGDIARCSVGKDDEYYNEELLYRMFGVNAELLIDHAWGWEPCTIRDIKAYRPDSSSIGSGQVLQCGYPYDKALVVLKEMADSLALSLVDKALVTDHIVLSVGYDKDSSAGYEGEMKRDRYGRAVPKGAHGSVRLDRYTSSANAIIKASKELFLSIIDKRLLVRRLYITACGVVSESEGRKHSSCDIDFFTDLEQQAEEREREDRERRVQQASLSIKKKYGKNAILKGLNYEEGATGRERNMQIGGHRA